MSGHSFFVPGDNFSLGLGPSSDILLPRTLSPRKGDPWVVLIIISLEQGLLRQEPVLESYYSYKACGGPKKRVGFLCNHLGGTTRPHESEVTRALLDYGEEQNLEILFISGRMFQSGKEHQALKNFFIQLPVHGALDGLLIHASILSRYLDDGDVAFIRKTLGDIPIVCLGTALDRSPVVLVDNREPVRRAVLHFYERHGARRIAFICGPENNREAMERFMGYQDALEELRIPFDPLLVAPGNFWRSSGFEGIEILVDERNVQFDSLIAANDETALGALEALTARGFSCPEDVRICGFDDIELVRLSQPPLATIRQDIYTASREGLGLLCAMMDGKPVPERIFVSATFIPRSSCGCNPNVSRTIDIPPKQDGCEGLGLNQTEWASLHDAMLSSFPPMRVRHKDFINKKIGDFLLPLKNTKGMETAFNDATAVMTRLLADTEAMDLDTGLWMDAIKVFRDHMKAISGNQSPSVENFCISIINHIFDFRADGYKRAVFKQEAYDYYLGDLSQAITGIWSLEDLGYMLARHLYKLGIRSWFIACSQDGSPQHLVPSLLYRYGEGLSTSFQSGAKISDLLIRSGENTVFVTESLIIGDEFLGIAVFEMSKPLGQLTAILRMHIAGVLNTIRSYEEDRRQREAIEKLNKDLSVQLKRLSSLRTIDMAITDETANEKLLTVLLAEITAQLGMDAASILLSEEGNEYLEFGAEKGFKTNALRYTKLKLGEGFAGKAAENRKLIFIPDLEANPESLTRAPLLRAEGFRSYCAAPLYVRGTLIGVMELFHHSVIHPNEEWLEFLEALAGQAAIALDNRKLIRGLHQANNDLLRAYDETIEGWSRALDLRDHETKGHSLRVAAASVELAKMFSNVEQELIHIYRGALLHDIGKVGIPDNILMKPGPLDEAEMALMRQHPQYAYDLLYPIEYLRPIIDIPYCHHEKWNGLGYPRGLAGKKIPFAARIFTVIDVWDALTSDRPYRNAWPERKTLDYIHDHAGIDFDPEVVKTFLRLNGYN